MKLLAIDTTGTVCTAAVNIDGEISVRTRDEGLTHSVSLMPMIDDLLTSLHISPADIDAFAAVTGPGSFTGIRIGVCAVKGFAQAADKPCIAINTLHSLSRNVGGVCCPMIDARNGTVYSALYDEERCIVPCGARPLCEMLALCAGKSVVFCGDGALSYRAEILLASPDFTIAPADKLLQSGESAARIAAEKFASGDVTDCFGIEPTYFRQFRTTPPKAR